MKDFELAYQLVRAIMETDEWERIWMEYPGVVEAKARLDEVMKKVPAELVNELWEAFTELDWANECASLLYGIRAAYSTSRAMIESAEFSQYAAHRRAEA